MPDVVLLDWNMPVMSGMEFLKLLRQRGHEDSPRSYSAPPKTTWRTFAPRWRPVPTNMS
jgi:CheY-like chemotaxis protein